MYYTQCKITKAYYAKPPPKKKTKKKTKNDANDDDGSNAQIPDQPQVKSIKSLRRNLAKIITIYGRTVKKLN